jgi:formate dehydrogenase maturation protein FdhE
MEVKVERGSVNVRLSGCGWMCRSCGRVMSKVVWAMSDTEDSVVVTPVCDKCGSGVTEVTKELREAADRYLEKLCEQEKTA